jgi:hypothetical protein
MSSLANAGSGGRGLTVDLAEFTQNDVYEFNSQNGEYTHTGSKYDFKMSYSWEGDERLPAGSGQAESPAAPARIRASLSAQPVSVQLIRRDQQGTLQWYFEYINPETGQSEPGFIAKKIKLSPGHTWAKYDRGETVEARIDSDSEPVAASCHLQQVVQDFYRETLKTSLEQKLAAEKFAGHWLNEPFFNSASPATRVVRLNKRRIEFMVRADLVRLVPAY